MYKKSYFNILHFLLLTILKSIKRELLLSKHHSLHIPIFFLKKEEEQQQQIAI
jgi:hypothetical protein